MSCDLEVVDCFGRTVHLRHSNWQRHVEKRPAIEPYHDQIVTLLTEAAEQGEVVSLDVSFTADAVLSAMTPPLYRYQRQTCGYTRERIIAGMQRLFVDGLHQKDAA